MGSAPSNAGSPSSSNSSIRDRGGSPLPNENQIENQSQIQRQSFQSNNSSQPTKKQSNGFFVFSYEPTHVPLANKRGAVKEGFPEHGLIQDRYFLIKDHFKGIDKLKTMKDCGAPNFRKARGVYSVYGMGQPSRDGLAKTIQVLLERGHKEIVSFNLREEPVIFVSLNHDYIPYSPRDPSSLKGNIANYGVKPDELAETEIKIREEVIKFSIEEKGQFYFYNDVDTFENEPHTYKVSYEEDLCVLDEIYSRQIFLTPCLRYSRIPITATNAPEEQDFDQFVSALKDIPSMFSTSSNAPSPALLFNCHVGQGRTTTGMVIGCLIMSHRNGFPAEANAIPTPLDENNPNYEKGEFRMILQLVRKLPNGRQIKQEVDVVIDYCSELMNLRTFIYECKKKVEDLTDYDVQGQRGSDYWLRRGMSALERYFFLILFNAYLHEQYPLVFAVSFCKWMRQRPWLYRMLSHIDVLERCVTAEFLGERYSPTNLVADHYVGLDVLSTQREVQVSNFRKVPGLPIYGMCQPSRHGLNRVVHLLLGPKHNHPRVVCFNVREDLVLDCDGMTFSQREVSDLLHSMNFSGLDASEIEQKESDLKRELQSDKTHKRARIYREVNAQPIEETFSSIQTTRDMSEHQSNKTAQYSYHRLPMPEEKAPEEKDFDRLHSILNNIGEIYSDEDGPALVFCCESGKGRTTVAMAIAGLIYCNKKGFPRGTKIEEQDPPCVPNAKYTMGEYSVIRHLMRILPNGPQRKREVDYILDKISETMTPMHYHPREVIFSVYNKHKNPLEYCSIEERFMMRRRSLHFLERYFYLILFNCYLYMERPTKWARPFSQWMIQVATAAGVYDILDNFGFHDFEKTEERLHALRWRWRQSYRGGVEVV